MKVLFCDPLNTQNNFYIFARCLQEAGIDAHVAMDSGGMIPESHQPGWHDRKGDEEWVHRLQFPFTLHPMEYRRRQSVLCSLVKQFDLVVCSGHVPMWIHRAGVPFIFFSYGSDLDQEATQGWSGIPRKITLVEIVRRYFVKTLLSRSLRKASAVVLSPYQVRTAQKLGLKNLRFLPHIIDTTLFRVVDDREEIKRTIKKTLGCDLLLFHPPRQVWTDRSIADCKGNDIVFRAFAEFVQGYEGRAKLVVIEKGWDVGASKRLIDELGIESSVKWLQPMPKNPMVRWYNIADVVLDQFVVGVLALVAVEAMACGTPVVTHVYNDTKLIYPDLPPVVNHSILGMDNTLSLLAGSTATRDRLSQEGRAWVEKNCSPKTAVPKYVELLEEVYAHR